MKGNPASPGGSLTSKPTWSNRFHVFDHVGFFLILLYRVQTQRNLFQWLNLDFLQFLVPAGFVGVLQTSKCRRLPGKIGVSSRAPKNGSIRWFGGPC